VRLRKSTRSTVRPNTSPWRMQALADVVYRLDDGVPGHIFEKLVDRGKVTVDCSTGLALVQPAKGGVNGTHHCGGRDRW
jgi:hypothetical protein